MSNSKKIIDNPTSAVLLQQIQAIETLQSLYEAFPFARKLFPKLENTFAGLSDIKKQVELLKIPDRFNECFASFGWIAYESMNLEAMKKAISIYESQGVKEAEDYLCGFYDEDCLKWGILRFNGNREFRLRIRLVELAKADYLSERYHACIPLLLSMLDGLVNDVSKHVGFFAKSAEMTAWDCIAAHESGLQFLSSLMAKGRKKTNEDPISIPYRHGILHGRELSFDNKIVAAKCWATLFAALDWAVAISNGKRTPKPKKEISWAELFEQITENRRQKKLLDAWRARTETESPHLPHSGDSGELPIGTPERAVAEFMENWCLRRYGLLAETLLYFADTTKSKKAGLAKEDFGKYVPLSFKILSVEDQAASVSHVVVELEFNREEGGILKQASVRVIYQDDQNNPMVRTEGKGQWKIVQNSLSNILYAIHL